MSQIKVTDRSIEEMVSFILRVGVSLAGIVVFTGGIYFLAAHGREAVDYHRFHGRPATERLVTEIFRGAWSLHARSLMQLGVLFLIATPICRVAFSLIGFALERDGTYVLITSLVLAILLYSLIAGVSGGI